MSLELARKRVNELRLEYDAACRAIATEETALAEAVREFTAAVEARTHIQGVVTNIQQRVHARMGAVVTRCLAAVFDDPYEFRIDFEPKRGQTEAYPVLIRRGHVLDDPMNQAGGGVIDVAAFALRLATLVLGRPARRRIILMDEPFRFANARILPLLREMLVTLATEMGIQFVITTHSAELMAGTVFHIEEGGNGDNL